MTHYKLSPQAAEDLDQIFDYGIDRFGVEQTINYVQKLKQHFAVLVENPKAYPRVSEIRQDYRRSVCGVHSVYYRIADETVEIMSIIGRQDLRKRL